MYAVEEDTILTLLYCANSVTIPVSDTEVTIHQETNYPYEGAIRMDLALEGVATFGLKLRIPTWALGEQFVPGKLYHFSEKTEASWSLKVNGEPVEAVVNKGFVEINRVWADGDRIDLDLPMPVRYNVCDEQVAANRGRVALTRGPLVLCAEEPDNAGAVQRFFAPELPSEDTREVNHVEEGILSGSPLITVPLSEIYEGEVRSTKAHFIPYSLWNNRGNSSMIVWLPTSEQLASTHLLKMGTDPTKYGAVSSSSAAEESDLEAIKAVRMPSSSSDDTIPAWISSGESKTEWLEMVFNEPQSIDRVGLYWVNRGSVELPDNWSMEYLQSGEWHPFKKYITDVFGLTADKFNTVHPAEELTCDGLRIHISSESGKPVGLFSVELNLL
jgi:hypothetical protein